MNMAAHEAYQCSNCGEFYLVENRPPESCDECGEEFCPLCIDQNGKCQNCDK